MIKHRFGIGAAALAACVISIPAWSHGGGMGGGAGGMGHGAGGMGPGIGMGHSVGAPGHGMGSMAPAAGGTGHGATVSAAAHSAHMSNQPVGASVRTVARSNSQGPAHASANAIAHVQNSPGKANSNSVLGTGTSSTASGTTRSHGKSHVAAMKTKAPKTVKAKSRASD